MFQSAKFEKGKADKLCVVFTEQCKFCRVNLRLVILCAFSKSRCYNSNLIIANQPFFSIQLRQYNLYFGFFIFQLIAYFSLSLSEKQMASYLFCCILHSKSCRLKFKFELNGKLSIINLDNFTSLKMQIFLNTQWIKAQEFIKNQAFFNKDLKLKTFDLVVDTTSQFDLFISINFITTCQIQKIYFTCLQEVLNAI